MQGMVLGHLLETLHEGLTVFREGQGTSIPMKSTKIDVDINAGLAVTRITRSFRNDEEVSIEAILTMPVAFDAIVTCLEAVIDGRKLIAASKAKKAARETYENAIDAGKMTILHEEALRGVHVLSVGQLGAGKEVSVTIETVAPLMQLSGSCFLRIPTTVGAIYGASPLLPADDLITSAAVKHVAMLSIKADAGQISLSDGSTPNEHECVEITLDRSIEISLSQPSFGKTIAMSATGHPLTILVQPIKSSDNDLNLAVLVDHSGSMCSEFGLNSFSRAPAVPNGKPLLGLEIYRSGVSKWDAVCAGLTKSLNELGPDDQIGMWQFDNECQFLGKETGPQSASLCSLIHKPRGGTELGSAVHKVVASGAKDVLIITDGQTWSNTVDKLRSKNARLSAILVGSDSLDANIGHLCANSGGHLYYALRGDVASILTEALKNLRRTDAPIKGKAGERYPSSLTAIRGSAEISIAWAINKDKTERPSDPIGRYAAALALPLLEPKMAQDFAELHCLSTHNTSLILVDEEGAVSEALPQMRKVPLMLSASAFKQDTKSEHVASRMATCERAPNYAKMRGVHALVARPTSGARLIDRQDPCSGSFFTRLFGAFFRKSSKNETTAVESAVKSTTPDSSTLHSLAMRIEWELLINDLLFGDIAKLSINDQSLVRQLAEGPEILSGAADLKISPLQFALLKLALMVEPEKRAAERFIRRTLKDSYDAL